MEEFLPMAGCVYVALYFVTALGSTIVLAQDLPAVASRALYLLAVPFQLVFVAAVAWMSWPVSSWRQRLSHVGFALLLTMPVLIWTAWRMLART